MSNFFCEDVVSLKKDSSILAVVQQTWADVELEGHDIEKDYYFHRSCSLSVRRSWHHAGKLLHRYVVIEFLNVSHGFCLIHESALQLEDRSFAVDDVVKKSAAEFQSGAIISTSLICGIQPVCTESQLQNASRGEEAFPAAPSFEISAAALEHYGAYREEDFVIFKDWVGQIDSIEEEVSVRLKNGNVVIVKDPHDLKEICFEPGSSSAKFHERLENLGYQASPRQLSKIAARSMPIGEYCHGGMFVETKKANLRLGRWIFGAHNANAEPAGIVVQSRTVKLFVDWLYPNVFLERHSRTPPPEVLTTDEIDSGELSIYDRSRLPTNSLSSQLQHATFSQDTSFGGYVKLKKAADLGATDREQDAVPQEHNLPVDMIPRTKAQGYDMNIYQINYTATTVRIRWQDGSVSDERTTALIPYLNVDDHDVWPGEKVSYRPQEESLSVEGLPGLKRTTKVGVVQSVDSIERMAKVRWFQDAHIDYGLDTADYGICRFGPIGNDITAVSLYELNTEIFPLTSVVMGRMVSVLPDPPFATAADCKRFNDLAKKIFSRASSTATQPSSAMQEFDDDLGEASIYAERAEACLIQATRLWGQPGRMEIDHSQSLDPANYGGRSDTMNCFGEVVELCLDGDVIVRLGAAADAREIKVATERVFVIADGDAQSVEDDDFSEFEEEDEDMETSEDESVPSMEANGSTVSMEVDENDSLKANTKRDTDEWETDEDWSEAEESPDDTAARQAEITQTQRSASHEPNASDEHKTQIGVELDAERRARSRRQPQVHLSRETFPQMPDAFSIVESPAAADHAMLGRNSSLSGEQMRRIAKEYRILATSLPEGVFARSWEQRLDLLRVLIVGPVDTPYEHSPFVFDLYLGESYPTAPPEVHFHSWSANSRVNPNLYEDGKVCLSLLGTWDAELHNESWSPTKSTLLQIVVSIVGLVLVREPYYNEAGFEILHGTPDSLVPSAIYSEKAYLLSKSFAEHALSQPPGDFKEIIEWLYVESDGPHLLQRIIQDCEHLKKKVENGNAQLESGNDGSDVEGWAAANKVSAGALVLLRKRLVWMRRFAGMSLDGYEDLATSML